MYLVNNRNCLKRPTCIKSYFKQLCSFRSGLQVMYSTSKMWLRIVVLCSVVSGAFSNCSIFLNDECICDSTRCLNKCCKEDYWLENGALCVKRENANSTPLKLSEEYENSKAIRWCENPTELTDEDLHSSEGFCVEENYEPSTGSLRMVKCAITSKIIHSVKVPVRKCCEKSEIMLNSSCKYRDSVDLDPLVKSISLRSGQRLVNSMLKCRKDRHRIRVDNFKLEEDGSLLWEDEVLVNIDSYCVDLFTSDGVNYHTQALLCLEADEEISSEVHATGMIISMPFLLLTFLVYLIIPEKNLHRKALMFYVICLLLAYVLLVTSNLSKYSFPDVTCHLIGYFIMFFFLGSFLWMNVMCIDMWLTFSGARGYGGTRSTEQKRFLFYCLYAVGVPAMFILFVFLLNTYGDEESIFHPKLGRNKCFLEDGYPQLFYLYLPMATLIGMNIILFILTAIKIQRVKMETAMLKQTDSRKHNYEGDKQQFNLYLKLLFAMGVNWTTEVISWAALWKMQSVPSWIWYLTDLINALYGIFIFFIFVFKKKIWQSLKKRYYVFIGKPHLAQTMVTSQNTRTSHMSSSEVGDYRMSDMRNGRAEERALRS